MADLVHRYLRRMWRASLQPGSLLTFVEAVDALPGPRVAARAWLDALPPAGEIGGEAVFRWGDIEAALTTRPTADDGSWISTSEAAARLGIARSTLDEMVSRAPKDLPGAPVHVGTGKARSHLRWDGDHVQEWLAAYRSWEVTLSSRRKIAAAAPSLGNAARTRREAKDGPVDWNKFRREVSGGER